jgi:serine/threonine protein kinase
VLRLRFPAGLLQSKQPLHRWHTRSLTADTRYEVDRETKITNGFFSDVYKGKWRGRMVAIKVLAGSTPRKLFVREIGIWKTLHHPNVLRLFGASSTSGDPPWFFVSPYMKNGSLVQHLKWVELEERPSNLGIGMGSSQMPLSPIWSSPANLGSGTFPPPWTPVRGISPTRRDLTPPGLRGRSITPEDTAIHREWDLFRFMHEIAKGMEYLHGEGVLHGDLKAANVLVDDKYRCVISDFGLSEMKSEVYRISGSLPPRMFCYYNFHFEFKIPTFFRRNASMAVT